MAIDDIALDEVSAPSMLERLIPSAARVILTESASMEVLLKRVTVSEVR